MLSIGREEDSPDGACRLQLIDAHAVVVDVDEDQLVSGAPQDRAVEAPARLLDGDPANAGGEERSAEQSKALREPGGHEQIARRDLQSARRRRYPASSVRNAS